MSKPVWSPTPDAVAATAMRRFHAAASASAGRGLVGTPDVHAWSLADPGAFWSLVWEEFGVVGDRGARDVVPATLPQAVFFPDARINLAENLLEPWKGSAAPAVVWVGEGDGAVELREEVSGADLRRRVGSFAAALRAHGIVPGDRVGLVLPEIGRAHV